MFGQEVIVAAGAWTISLIACVLGAVLVTTDCQETNKHPYWHLTLTSFPPDSFGQSYLSFKH